MGAVAGTLCSVSDFRAEKSPFRTAFLKKYSDKRLVKLFADNRDPLLPRFSAPHEAWSVNLTVTECKQTSTLSAVGQCPLALRATSGVAPVPDEEVDLEVERRTTAINCSTDPCQGSMSPEPGEWSYLLVEPVGGPVEFKLLLIATGMHLFSRSFPAGHSQFVNREIPSMHPCLHKCAHPLP